MNYQILKNSKTADTIIYLIGQDKIEINNDVIVVNIIVDNWNDELSPWPLSDDKMSFAGKAESSREILLEYIKEIEKGKQIAHRYIAGYSLAGLFVLYILTKTDLFEKAASCSGSLWYTGFLEYFKNSFTNNKTRIYLSLGEREEKTKNVLMQPVGDKTRQIFTFLKENGNGCIYEINSGGHFNDVENRIRKAINWMTDKG